MARIGIIDVDSTIPNLALMKLSAWHKSQGDHVEMHMPIMPYDRIYASKIFKFSDAVGLDPEKMVIGGTGWDMAVSLPDEIEAMTPDYSLYDGTSIRNDYSIGFTMRGCRLKCSFCVVPEKEGKPKPNSTIEEIWTRRDSHFIKLLDNDFFGNPSWPDRIEEIKALNLSVNFNQGLNIRNIRPEQAEALASIRFRNSSGKHKQVHFAWDDPRHEKLIHKGIRICAEAGIKPYQMAFYVLIGYHSTPDEDLHRVEVLRSYGCDPYVMPYDKSDPYQMAFKRWVNRKQLFNSVKWEDYSHGQWNRPKSRLITTDKARSLHEQTN